MTTRSFLDKFVAGDDFVTVFGYNVEYKPSPVKVFATIHWVVSTFAAETMIEFVVDAKAKLHYVADKANFKVYGLWPLSYEELAYMMFVSSLVYYNDPDVEISLAWTKLHWNKYFGNTPNGFISYVESFCE